MYLREIWWMFQDKCEYDFVEFFCDIYQVSVDRFWYSCPCQLRVQLTPGNTTQIIKVQRKRQNLRLHDFTTYLKEKSGLGYDQHFSFKYFLNQIYLSNIQDVLGTTGVTVLIIADLVLIVALFVWFYFSGLIETYMHLLLCQYKTVLLIKCFYSWIVLNTLNICTTFYLKFTR